MFCLIYYFLSTFLKYISGFQLKTLSIDISFSTGWSVFFLSTEWTGEGARKIKSKEICKRVNEGYYLATWFDSIHTLRFEVMQYLMTTSSLLCWTGTCSAQYINVCWSCWSTHWGTCVSSALRKWTPFLPQQDLFWPTSYSPFSASHISCFLIRESPRGKGSFRRPVLHPAQRRINTEFRWCCSGIYQKKCWKSVNNLLQWLTALPMVWLFTDFQLRFWLTHGSCYMLPPDVCWGQCCSAKGKATCMLHTVARKS